MEERVERASEFSLARVTMIEEGSFLRRVLLVLFLAALTIGAFIIGWFTIRIWLAVFAGILLAIFLRSLSSWLAAHTSLSEAWSLALVVVTILTIGALGGYLLADPLSRQFSELAVRVPEAMERLRAWAGERQWLSAFGDGQSAASGVAAKSSEIAGKVLSAFSSTLEFMTGVAVVLFTGLYLAAQPGPYFEGTIRLFPPGYRGRATQILTEIGCTLRQWIVGQLVSMLAVGLLTGLGLYFLKIPLPVALGVIAGVLDFIPVFGPVLAAVPAILLAFLVGPWHALYVVALFIVVNQIESHLLIPLIQNYTVSLRPAVTVVALVLFGSLFGFLGLLLATPLAATLQILVKSAYVEGYLERPRELPG